MGRHIKSVSKLYGQGCNIRYQSFHMQSHLYLGLAIELLTHFRITLGSNIFRDITCRLFCYVALLILSK
jgi:hypothetical protein